MLTDVLISSGNTKTGKMPTISRPIAATCPTTCAFLPKNLGGNGKCYANGRINGTVAKLAQDLTVAEAAERVALKSPKKIKAKYLRDRVVGDVMTGPRDAQTVDLDYVAQVAEVATINDLIAYGYTHAWEQIDPSEIPAGYVMNASTNTVEELERAVKMGWATTIANDEVADGDVIGGRRVITCPEQTGKAPDCATCGLCAKPNRAVTVRFLMH